jgi:adenylate kinase family enzyme
MKKIIIFGSSGAGKSTFAKLLSKYTGINLVHLDQEYWKPSWVRTDSDVFKKRIKELISEDEWIMDGNYRNTMDMRIAKADTIIFLDFSRWTCLFRLFKRRLKNNRVDVLNCCDEQITYELIKWILWIFPRINRKEILNKINKVKNKKKVVILKSNKQMEEFLKNYIKKQL